MAVIPSLVCLLLVATVMDRLVSGADPMQLSYGQPLVDERMSALTNVMMNELSVLDTRLKDTVKDLNNTKTDLSTQIADVTAGMRRATDAFIGITAKMGVQVKNVESKVNVMESTLGTQAETIDTVQQKELELEEKIARPEPGTAAEVAALRQDVLRVKQDVASLKGELEETMQFVNEQLREFRHTMATFTN